jgi:hypothetical protein
MTKNERLQALIHRYKQETGEKAVDLEQVADWAIRQGATLPQPKTARELFAAQLADAARAEYRVDPKTGLSYRANHALRNRTRDGRQMVLWRQRKEPTEDTWIRRMGPVHFEHINFRGIISFNFDPFADALLAKQSKKRAHAAA